MDEIKETLIKYLSLGSCDGKYERRELRKKLAELLELPYDDKKFKLKETKCTH